MDAASSAAQGLTTMRTLNLLALLTGNKEGSKGLMVPRVKPTPTRFLTKILYTQMANTRLRVPPVVFEQ